MPRLLPLFPLQLVAFPGSVIPLHIFEDRYKEMVGEAEASGTAFGIVLAKDEGIVNAGCTVVVEKVVERYPDGRFDIVTRGQRRFTIQSIDQEKPYIRAEVEYFEDDDWEPVTPEIRAKALLAMKRLGIELPKVDLEHPFLSFELARTVDDLDFQHVILRSRSEAERLRQFTAFIETYIPKKRYIEKMGRLAPTNGHGHKPANV
ncbi:MAG: LON peptidase substrate-binding domain-containing protein [Acidobacteriota bacterium]|nr:LON peptidase substrate-binding domain-containing protein [Acidobacteriota bacterium]